MNKLFNMFSLAMRGHTTTKVGTLTRKWGIDKSYNPIGWADPYMVHPMRCHRRYIETTSVRNEDEECGMIGHDLLEDCYDVVTEKDIILASGEEALRIIKELTFPTSGPEWEGRKRDEKRKVEFEHLRAIRPKTMRLKMIDRWDNLDGMANQNTPKRVIAKYIPETETLLEICEATDWTIAAYVRAELEILKKYLASNTYSPR